MKNHYFTSRFENSVSTTHPLFKTLLTACCVFFSQRLLFLGSYKKVLFRLSLLLSLFVLVNKSVVGQTTVTYTMQTGNFNTTNTEKNNNPPYAGTYNNSATEMGQYCNGGSFGNTPGAAAFQTFTQVPN